MKKAKPVALVGAGNLTDSPLIRFLRFSDRLGPIKSPTYRLASRISNILRAGHPVRDYAPFEARRLILVCVPDATLPEILTELESSPIGWPGKAIVICSSCLDSSRLSALSAHGASVGSISPISGFEGSREFRYLIEGDKLAVFELKRLIARPKQNAITIERSHKPFYQAALACSRSLMPALLSAASDSLHHAGLPPDVSAEILEKQFGRALRSYLKSGRNLNPPPLEVSGQWHVLSAADPVLASYIEQSYRLSSRLLNRR